MKNAKSQNPRYEVGKIPNIIENVNPHLRFVETEILHIPCMIFTRKHETGGDDISKSTENRKGVMRKSIIVHKPMDFLKTISFPRSGRVPGEHLHILVNTQ